MKTPLPTLTPLLIVRDAARAIAFYVEALGARELVRFTNQALGVIGHADLAIGEARISITEEARDWNSDAPPSLGGSPVVLQVRVEDVSAVFESMQQAGADVVFPITVFCGERMARLRDPFGHLWIISQRIEELDTEEIQRQRDAFVEKMVAEGAIPSGSPKTG